MEKILLNVGCGPRGSNLRLPELFRSQGWREVRVDLDPAVRPDLIASITDLSGVPDNSIDALWSSHNIEHLYRFEVPKALAEFLRVLKPEGFVYLKTPDIQAVAELIAADQLHEAAYESQAGAITPHDMIFGHEASIAGGNLFMAHHSGFTATSLGTALRTAGFATAMLKRKEYLELSALGFKQDQNQEVYRRILAELAF
ncbi:MAG: Methyltransferase type 11 [Rhodospirillales bacterium]|nr:Methyltransferase type 11 [Rhodospirillales bacterium]